MSLHAELNIGDELFDSDEVSRYCKPGSYDRRRCEPRVSAFLRRRCTSGPSEGELLEDDLSINRLQYFQLDDREAAVDCIRQEILSQPFNLERNGRFVVFYVGEAKTGALEKGDFRLLFLYTPNCPVRSHSSIFNMPDNIDSEREIATAIKRLICKSDTHFAVVPQ